MLLKWTALDAKIEDRIWEVMERWENTPYMAGMRTLKSGVDCVQLVAGVLDELYRFESRTEVPRMSPDASEHSDMPGQKVVAALRRGYPCEQVPITKLEVNEIEPGDIIVVKARHTNGGPERYGHTMIASPRQGVALEAVPVAGVQFGCVEATTGILAVYRMQEKHRWA